MEKSIAETRSTKRLWPGALVLNIGIRNVLKRLNMDNGDTIMSLDSDIDYPRCVFCEVAYGSPECQECPEYEGNLEEETLDDL